jgi:hypothetical protein
VKASEGRNVSKDNFLDLQLYLFAIQYPKDMQENGKEMMPDMDDMMKDKQQT